MQYNPCLPVRPAVQLFWLLQLPWVASFHHPFLQNRNPTILSETRNGFQSRRDVISHTSNLLVLSSWGFLPSISQARGLVQFPCQEPLGNTYHFLCAGESLLDEQDIWSTNPLFVTNREAALSDRGVEQVEHSIQQVLLRNNINPTIIRYAIAAASTDTCNLVARELKVGRDKLVPEFNYLEPRAIGAWDMTARSTTEPAVWAMDEMEAGRDGLDGRPPPNEDGTPHERLADVAVRLRQLLSVLETQCSGDVVLLVACEGTTLALLSCMIAGIPFQHVHELEYMPGEVRLNVTMQSTLALWNERKAAGLEQYSQIIERGKVELKRLRSMTNIVSLKDQRMDEEQREMDAVYNLEQARKRRVETEQQRARQERVQRISTEPSTVPPVATISIGLGLVAAAAIVNGANVDQVDPNLPYEPRTPIDDAPAPLVVSELAVGIENSTVLPPTREERIFDPKWDLVEKSSKPLPWTASPASFRQIDSLTSSTASPPPIPGMTADEAMEDYLNQDDGMEGWLQVMSELISSQDDDES